MSDVLCEKFLLLNIILDVFLLQVSNASTFYKSVSIFLYW